MTDSLEQQLEQAMQKLRETEERFQLALDGSKTGLWDWDVINDVAYFSPYWKAMLGYADSDIPNSFQGWQQLWHPDDVEAINQALEDYTSGQTDEYEILHRLKHKNGEWRWILTRGQTISRNGVIQRWVGTNVDVTDYKRLETELAEKNQLLEELANTDPLTKLFNRNKIDQVLDSELLRANRYAHSFAVIMIDVDHFKKVNDDHGHQVGDRILQEFADVISSNVREVDTVGRWGGEEFIVICSETDLSGALTLAENLRIAVASHAFSIAESKTASFGVAEYNKKENITALVNRADTCLYKAKELGRNRVEQ